MSFICLRRSERFELEVELINVERPVYALSLEVESEYEKNNLYFENLT